MDVRCYYIAQRPVIAGFEDRSGCLKSRIQEFVNEAVQANLQAISNALNNFARGITLARPVMHPSMEFASLVLALLMSTFLWHFLVAVRRFRRG